MITRTHPGSLPPLVPVPTGCIVAVSRGVAGSRVGFLRCDGAYVSQDAYRSLFNLVQHTFSAGVDPNDGTFRLPALADRYLAGGSTGQIATNAGAASHSHTWSSSASISAQTDAAGPLWQGDHGHSYGNNYTATYYYAYHNHGVSGSLGASTGTGLINRATGNVDTPIGTHNHAINHNTGSDPAHSHAWNFNHSGTTHSHAASLTQDTRTGVNALTGQNLPPRHRVVYLIKT